jgi:hypothetical protein
MKTSNNIKCLLITAASILCLGASAFAGPGPRFIMIDGQMMEVTPLASDVTLANGCLVCMTGTVTPKHGHPFKLHNGEMLSATGVKMSPSALHGHGG